MESKIMSKRAVRCSLETNLTRLEVFGNDEKQRMKIQKRIGEITEFYKEKYPRLINKYIKLSDEISGKYSRPSLRKK